MNFRFRSRVAFVMIGLFVGLVPVPSVRAEAAVANPGDLIRGTSFLAVYYVGDDGFRYVFPNDKTYFTWYSDFSTVKMVSDADLATIQLGGNVTYRPGVKMIKINSDPKTYMVTQAGVLRWIPSEEMAVLLYGAEWSKSVDDVPDGFFGNYTVGDVLADADFSAGGASMFAAETMATTERIANNYWWAARAPISVNFTDRGLGGIYGGSFSVYEGDVVRFRNEDVVVHAATADDNSWGTGTVQPGHSFLHRFVTSGTYTYHDSYFPEETGAIVVEEVLTM